MAVRRVTTQLEGWWTSTNRGLWKKYTVGGLQLDGLLPSFFFFLSLSTTLSDYRLLLEPIKFLLQVGGRRLSSIGKWLILV